MPYFARDATVKLSFVSMLGFLLACHHNPIEHKPHLEPAFITKESDDGHPSLSITGSSNEPHLPRGFLAAFRASNNSSCAPPALSVGQDGLLEIKGQLLQEIYSYGLSQENAVSLALVNNPDLFAYYQNLELGYAGLIEAGLRQNPVVSMSTRAPNEPGYKLNKLFDTAESFLDYFLIPLRTRAAEADIHVIEAQIKQKVFDLIKDVQIHWLHVKMMELQLDLEAKRVELKEIAAGLAELQKKAGNSSSLFAREKKIQLEEAIERFKSLVAESAAAKEQLNRSLGLFGNEACWHIAGAIDWKIDPLLPDVSFMEETALENRPDIEAIRQEIDAIAKQADLKQWWTYSNLKVGISSERQPEGLITTGPAIEFEVPIYNFGQGEMKKFDALLKQARERLLSKATNTCSEVREFSEAAQIYRAQLEDLELKILPDFAKQVADAQAHYNVMAMGVYALFDTKESELNAMIEHVLAQKHYKEATIKLLHAVGGSFAQSGRTP